ncbi:MAG: bifunctional metallophosphatase/5'-nucleotidase, partial [Acidobacteria bacterium]|nr:bifunctional metallophosphatase/5'-nucleotidase [Acidobacteriota bacterium]
KKNYSLGCTLFLAEGGDGYSMLKNAMRLMDAESAPIDSTVLENAIKATGAIAPQADGRSKRLDQ